MATKDIMLNQSDHDLLITLKATVDNNHTNLSEKMDGLKIGIESTNKLIDGKLVNHETRIRSLEGLKDRFDPETLARQVEANTKWIEAFKIRWQTILTMVAVVQFVGGVILTLILKFWIK